MTVDKDFLLILKSSAIGDGEPDLGEKLMASFLNMLLESDRLPDRVICMNSGVFLTTAGTPVADQMSRLAEAGATIVSCGTCLEYYGRTDRLVIGTPGNMRDTVAAMLSYQRVVSP